MQRQLSQLEADLIKSVYPVTKATYYGKGCYEFTRTARQKSNAIKPERGKIMSMSKRSLLRLIFTMQCTNVCFKSMLTLTYPKHYPKAGKIVKADINLMAQKARRKDWSYLWFLEFQVRGAPHIHFLFTQDCITPHLRASFGLAWTERIVLSDWFREACPEEDYIREVVKIAKFNCHVGVFEVLRLEDGAKRYTSKYASKQRQKKVPRNYLDVGRFWGASRDVKPEGLEFDVDEEDVERWLVDNNHPATSFELVPRYIWGLGTIKKEALDPGDTTSVFYSLDGKAESNGSGKEETALVNLPW